MFFCFCALRLVLFIIKHWCVFWSLEVKGFIVVTVVAIVTLVDFHQNFVATVTRKLIKCSYVQFFFFFPPKETQDADIFTVKASVVDEKLIYLQLSSIIQLPVHSVPAMVSANSSDGDYNPKAKYAPE